MSAAESFAHPPSLSRPQLLAPRCSKHDDVARPSLANWRLSLLAAAILEHERQRVAREQLLIAGWLLSAREPRPRRARGWRLSTRGTFSRDLSEWTREITALEAWIDGRRPLSFLNVDTKKYRPVYVDWAELRDEHHAAVREAMSGVVDALAKPRVIGEAGVECLIGLNKTYKRWCARKIAQGLLIDEANAVTRFIESAPKPTPALEPPETPKPVFSREEITDAYGLIRKLVDEHTPARFRDDVEEQARTELLFPSGRVEPTTLLEEWVTRAYWRADKRVRGSREIAVGFEESDRRNAGFNSSFIRSRGCER